MVDPAPSLPARTLSLGAAVTWVERPVVLTLPGPDPRGRELPVVERLLTLTALTSLGLTPRASLDLALPATLQQRGSGLEGLTSYEAPSRPALLRDPRLGLSVLLAQSRGADPAAIGIRYVLSFPLGDERRLAGESAMIGAPSLTVAATRGPFHAGAAIGARFRAPVRIGDTRLGTSLTAAAGVGYALLPRERLTLALEATATPVLVRQPSQPGDRRSTVVPAEWLFALSSSPFGANGPSVLIGVGTGLPWSRIPDGLGGESAVAAVTTPGFRSLLRLRQPLSPPARTSRPR